MPEAVAGYIHGFAAPMLLGHDPLAIELHWRRLYEVIAHTVGKGAELRGLSAIDVCLWDILGQAAGMPVWQVLGGAARDRIRTYNTCGGPHYGRAAKGGTGYGTDRAAAGKYEDLIAFMERPGELALDLLSEGLTGMKLWPFDYVAHFPGGWDNWRSFRGMFDPDIRSLGGHDIVGGGPRPRAGAVPRDSPGGRRPDGDHGRGARAVVAARGARRSPAPWRSSARRGSKT